MLTEREKLIINDLLVIKNEKWRRFVAGVFAERYGRGGVTAVSEATGMSRKTIAAGVSEIEEASAAGTIPGEDFTSGGRIRKEGGGRKSVVETQPGIIDALHDLVDSYCYGNPMNPLTYTTKSLRHLADALKKQDYKIEYNTVGTLLSAMNYSLHGNMKMNQVGEPHPDRDAQFRFINDSCIRFMMRDVPVISVDCKKKENIGNFKNAGVEYMPKGEYVEVMDHDFLIPEKGKAVPYGIYDITRNEGYVSVGISSDTAQFAVHSIRNWWDEMGNERYPNADTLYITCDGGGSNGSRSRLWKTELQKFSNETGLTIYVSHFPPGTSKWNKIEHRLFCYITKNWRGRPLVDLVTIVSLIANTTTEQGLTVQCDVDPKKYETGIKVSDEDLSKVNISRDDFHGDWNYSIAPSEYSE